MARTPRPGGRTARTREAVFEAVAALIAERDPASISMTDIAGGPAWRPQAFTGGGATCGPC